MKYKKGDIVKVYSLQSFHGGGFICGTQGIVAQDQYSNSVLVAIERKIKGELKIDPSYEVYPQQLEFVHRSKSITVINKFNKLISKLKRS